MTVEETKKILASIKTAYPEFNRDLASEDDRKAAVRLWHKMLEPFCYEDISRVVIKHIQECKFAPKICEIYQPVRRLHESRPSLEQLERLKRIHAEICNGDELPEHSGDSAKYEVVISALPAARAGLDSFDTEMLRVE